MDLSFGRSTNRLPLPACNTPVSAINHFQCVRDVGKMVGGFFCEMVALQAESSDWFHTDDWTTNTLWTLVRDSRCNCGLDPVMSAIFHRWATWLQPWLCRWSRTHFWLRHWLGTGWRKHCVLLVNAGYNVFKTHEQEVWGGGTFFFWRSCYCILHSIV